MAFGFCMKALHSGSGGGGDKLGGLGSVTLRFFVPSIQNQKPFLPKRQESVHSSYSSASPLPILILK
jgi:hypothetical protein